MPSLARYIRNSENGVEFNAPSRNISVSEIDTDTANFKDITTGTVTSTTGNITNLTVDTLSVTHHTTENHTADNITAESVTTTEFNTTNGVIGNANIPNLESHTAAFHNADITNLTAQTGTVLNSTIVDSTFNRGSINTDSTKTTDLEVTNNAEINNINLTGRATVNDLDLTTGVAGTLYTTTHNGVISNVLNLYPKTIGVDDIIVNTSINATAADIDNLTAPIGNVTTLTSNSATISSLNCNNLDATSADIDTLTAPTGTVNNLSSDTATVTTLNVVDVNYSGELKKTGAAIVDWNAVIQTDKDNKDISGFSVHLLDNIQKDRYDFSLIKKANVYCMQNNIRYVYVQTKIDTSTGSNLVYEHTREYPSQLLSEKYPITFDDLYELLDKRTIFIVHPYDLASRDMCFTTMDEDTGRLIICTPDQTVATNDVVSAAYNGTGYGTNLLDVRNIKDVTSTVTAEKIVFICQNFDEYRHIDAKTGLKPSGYIFNNLYALYNFVIGDFFETTRSEMVVFGDGYDSWMNNQVGNNYIECYVPPYNQPGMEVYSRCTYFNTMNGNYLRINRDNNSPGASTLELYSVYRNSTLATPLFSPHWYFFAHSPVMDNDRKTPNICVYQQKDGRTLNIALHPGDNTRQYLLSDEPLHANIFSNNFYYIGFRAEYIDVNGDGTRDHVQLKIYLYEAGNTVMDIFADYTGTARQIITLDNIQIEHNLFDVNYSAQIYQTFGVQYETETVRNMNRITYEGHI